MNKFGSLIADVSKPFRVELIDPTTDDVIRDKEGKISYIDVWSTDGEKARSYGKAKRKELSLRIKQSRNGKVEQDDALEENMAVAAAVTDGWYLVDRLTGEQIDVPFTSENAADLYAAPGAGWIFLQAFTGASSAANFLQRPSKLSASTQNQSSATVES